MQKRNNEIKVDNPILDELPWFDVQSVDAHKKNSQKFNF